LAREVIAAARLEECLRGPVIIVGTKRSGLRFECSPRPVIVDLDWEFTALGTLSKVHCEARIFLGTPRSEIRAVPGEVIRKRCRIAPV
jgi:hypothetical protein